MMARAVLVAILLPVAATTGFLGKYGKVVIMSQPRAFTTSASQQALLQTAPVSAATRQGASRSRSGRTELCLSKKASKTALSRDQEMADMLRWAADEAGVKAPKIKAGFADGLRGVIATQSISPNEEMVIVPSESALVTTTDQLCPFPEWISKEYWAKSPWEVRMALLLLREKQKGAESKLEPWISRLPESFGTPIAWSATELSELQYPSLETEVKEQRKKWGGFHSSLMESSPGCGVTEPELTWAMGVGYSRAFSGPYEGRGPKERLTEVAFVAALAAGSVGLGLGTPEQVANGALAVLIGIPLRDFFITKLAQLRRYMLTPVVDFINHRSDVASDVSFNYFYGYFAVTSERGWQAGEQIFISYGPRSNDFLLQRYGFVEPNNPYDAYRITGILDKLSALLGEDSIKVLRGSGAALGTEPVDSVSVGKGGLVDEKETALVMPALRLAVVKDDQLPEGKVGEISLEDFSKEISPSNERAARDILRELCIREREGLATDMGQDEASISSMGKSFGANKRLALAFRIEKKRVLNAAIASMEENSGRDVSAGGNDRKSGSAASTTVTA